MADGHRHRNKRKITIISLHFRLILSAHHCAEEAVEQLCPLPDHQFPRDPPDAPTPASSFCRLHSPFSRVLSSAPPPLTTGISGARDYDGKGIQLHRTVELLSNLKRKSKCVAVVTPTVALETIGSCKVIHYSIRNLMDILSAQRHYQNDTTNKIKLLNRLCKTFYLKACSTLIFYSDRTYNLCY